LSCIDNLIEGDTIMDYTIVHERGLESVSSVEQIKKVEEQFEVKCQHQTFRQHIFG